MRTCSEEGCTRPIKVTVFATLIYGDLKGTELKINLNGLKSLLTGIGTHTLMKMYLVERTDRTGYDEYDSFVVIAESEEEAIALVIEEDFNKSVPWHEADAIEITLDEGPRVILGSFNAG